MPSKKLSEVVIPIPVFGYVNTILADRPAVYHRCNTTSSTEPNLGFNGGAGTITGSTVTRNSTGGPIPSGGYFSITNGSGAPGLITADPYLSKRWSIELFMRIPTAVARSGMIFARKKFYAAATTDFPLEVAWDNTNKRIQVALDYNQTDYSGDQLINTANNIMNYDQWYHLVVCFGGSGEPIKVFIDASEVVSVNASGDLRNALRNYAENRLKIGSAIVEYDGGVNISHIHMDFAEFAYYDYYLPLDRILAHYQARTQP
jgi:hypothetical protein